MNTDRDRLVLAHTDLVARTARMVKRKVPRSVDFEDLIGAGTIGLLSAASRYHSSAVPFPAFAQRRVLGAMQDALRDLDWVPRSVRRAGRAEGRDVGGMCAMEDSYLNLPDGKEGALDRLERQELRDRVVGAVQALPARERRLVARCVVGDTTKAAMARRMGLSEARVSQLVKQALARLRTALQGCV